MAIINGTNGNDLITPGAISPGVSGFPTALADTINGLAGADSIDGGGGDDVIFGDASFSNVTGQWNDTLDGGTGSDTMHGFDGNDTYIVDVAGDDIDSEINDGIGGVDTVRSTKANTSLLDDFTDGFALENLVLVGNSALNGIGNDNNNVLTGNGRANSLFAGAGNDTVLGGGGNDIVDGATGNDIVRGQGGNDVVAGGSGVDIRIGGQGNDTFQFLFLTPGEIDVVRQGDGASAFQGAGNAVGDIFDLQNIDANAGAGGNQSFIFGGVGARHLVVANIAGGISQVRGNTDGDAAFELVINIEDGAVNANQYTAADFIL